MGYNKPPRYFSERWFVQLPTKQRLFGRRKEGTIYEVHHAPSLSKMSEVHISMRAHLI
jgi:hypothetical protein